VALPVGDFGGDLSRRDTAIRDALQRAAVKLVVCAGYDRVLTAPVLDAFPDAILNVHPSLLPAFPGVDAQRQAWEYGTTLAGATVHFVTGALDGGPIVRQAAVPVLETDTPDTLAARILEQEHRIYPEAVADVLAGGWTIDGRRFCRHPRPATANERPSG
jgi:phosphoribosylglycinamide formyltransferase-1